MKKRSGNLTAAIFLTLIAVDILNACAELSFKKGALATHIHHVVLSNFFEFASGLLSSAGLWIGILCYLVMFLLWMTILSRIDLSVAFLILSADYLLVPFLSIIFLKEGVPFLRWIGIALIAVGIGFTSWSAVSDRNPQT